MKLKPILAATAFLLGAAPGGPPVAPVLDWSVSPASIPALCSSTQAVLAARVRTIVRARGPRTFSNTTLVLENAMADASDALAPSIFMQNVSTDSAVRDAARQCDVDFAARVAQLTSDPALYKAVDAAVNSDTARGPYQEKLGELWLQRIARSGAGLPPKKRDELLRLERELLALQAQFARNLADAGATISLSQRDLDGVPADAIALYARGPNGSYVVPVDESTLSFLDNARSESARKTYYLAYNRRGAPANVTIFERALALRDRMAHLLGYESWASYQLADRMAGSTAAVEKFLTSASDALRPPARAEMSAMLAALANERGNAGSTLEPWNVRRGEYLLRKAASVDPEAIRQYFPVQHTIDAVLDVYHTLLGVDFEQVTPADAWTEGVLEYRVSDTATHRLLGTSYFDLFPRPGKFEHFASFTLLPHRGNRIAVAAIVGNWPPPGNGAPALLSHADVVTFFHELGHDLAAMLATAPYETLSDGFREDFVEAPSEMLENFAWQPEILKRVSSNRQTGEPMDDATIERLVATRRTASAYEMLRLLTMASIDVEYHSMGPHVDSTQVWARATQASLPTLYVAGTYPQVAFGHLMGGYDAGLYAYPWSAVYAADLFTAFSGTTLLDPEVGMRYRNDVLAPARTYEPNNEVRAFLKRAPSPDAFYAQYGIAPASPAP